MYIMSSVILGVVHWYDVRKGYGFIRYGEDMSESVFVYHGSLCVSGDRFRYLLAGEYVNFELGERDGRSVALSVTGVSGGSLMCDVRGQGDKKKRKTSHSSGPVSE